MLLTTKELLFFSSCCFPFFFFSRWFPLYDLLQTLFPNQESTAATAQRCCLWVSGYCNEQSAADFKAGERKHFSQGHGCSLEAAAAVCRSAENCPPRKSRSLAGRHCIVWWRGRAKGCSSSCVCSTSCAHSACASLCPGIWVMRLEQAEEHELRFLLPNVNIFSVTA